MSDTKKIAIFSDLHLGVHINSPTWHEISYDWAKWYTNEIKEKDIDTVIFCGDFFHSRSEITVNTLHQAGEILDLFADFNIYMIAGNHDSFYKNNCSVNSIRILRGRDNITVFDKPGLHQINGVECFFSPWGTNINDIEESDIIFGHFEIESFKMNSYKLCEEGVKSGELLARAPLVISGHFHLREERKYEKGTVLYVGSPFELDFGDESSTKGYYILDVNKKTYTFHENNVSPKHIKINLSELIKIKNFSDHGTNLFKKNIIKLAIDKSISNLDLDKLSTKLNTFKPISLTIDNLTTFDKFGAATQDEIDLSGVDISKAITDFVEMLDIQNKKDVTEYTISLYNQCK